MGLCIETIDCFCASPYLLCINPADNFFEAKWLLYFIILMQERGYFENTEELWITILGHEPRTWASCRSRCAIAPRSALQGALQASCRHQGIFRCVRRELSSGPELWPEHWPNRWAECRTKVATIITEHYELSCVAKFSVAKLKLGCSMRNKASANVCYMLVNQGFEDSEPPPIGVLHIEALHSKITPRDFMHVVRVQESQRRK